MNQTQSSFSKDEVVRIKAISKKFDHEILECLGLDNINPKGCQCACPIHGGDNATAFSYDSDRKIWSCFTKHCHKKYGNDMIGLIRSVLDCTFAQAVSWINENIGINEEINLEDIYNSSSVDDYLSAKGRKNESIDESKLDNLKKDFSSIQDRGFSEELISEFEAGLCLSELIIHQRIMLPIRNIEGSLIGFTGRSIHSKNEVTGGYYPSTFKPKQNTAHFFSKWRNYPKKLNKSIELYNIHKAKPYIKETNSCFVVEGPFDLWRMWSFGFKNCVASLGTGLTEVQAKTIADQGCMDLYVMYDSDDAGARASENIKSRFSNNFNVYIINMPRGKDPADLTKDELYSIVPERLISV